MSASPWPPPPQIAAPPSSTPRRRISYASSSTMRAPLAPIGWPSATAPPFTFTSSSSKPSIRVTCSATAANASFTSRRPRSWTSSPAFFSACCIARAGTVWRYAYRSADIPWATISASGSSPSSSAVARPVTTTAAPPFRADDLAGHAPLGERATPPPRVGPPVRARRPRVLLPALDPELCVHLVGGLAHHLLQERRVQAVVDHRVDEVGVAEPGAGPRAEQQVGGLGHRLQPPGHDEVDLARPDQLIGERDRVQAREADLVDRERGHLDGDATVHGGLPSGDLSGTGMDHVSHDHVVDAVAGDARSTQRLGDGHAAELDRRARRERPLELPDRGSSTGDDDRGTHEPSLRRARARLSDDDPAGHVGVDRAVVTEGPRPAEDPAEGVAGRRSGRGRCPRRDRR